MLRLIKRTIRPLPNDLDCQDAKCNVIIRHGGDEPQVKTNKCRSLSPSESNKPHIEYH